MKQLFSLGIIVFVFSFVATTAFIIVQQAVVSDVSNVNLVRALINRRLDISGKTSIRIIYAQEFFKTAATETTAIGNALASPLPQIHWFEVIHQ